MTKKKQKKPTLNEVKQVVENLIHDLTIINNKVDAIALILNDYVVFKEDTDAFTDFVKKKKEKADDKQGTANKDTK